MKMIKLDNGVGGRCLLPETQAPLCAQCLSPMRYTYHFFTSERVAYVTFICEHKLTTRQKTIAYRFNKKGLLSR